MYHRLALSVACLAALTACVDSGQSLEPAAPGAPLAAITREFPGEDDGPPFYSLLERLFIPHTDDWAAVVFVRDPWDLAPSCNGIPEDFNLLDQFAPPAFGCRLTVEGHASYKGGPPPIHVLMRGLGAVPILFASWPEFQAAISDDVLTMPELLSMRSLRIGFASSFELTQHPGSNRPQGFGNGKIELVARGAIRTGGSFFFQVREMGIDQVSVLRHIAIELDEP